jgi:hypothetical protein
MDPRSRHTGSFTSFNPIRKTPPLDHLAAALDGLLNRNVENELIGIRVDRLHCVLETDAAFFEYPSNTVLTISRNEVIRSLVSVKWNERPPDQALRRYEAADLWKLTAWMSKSEDH